MYLNKIRNWLLMCLKISNELLMYLNKIRNGLFSVSEQDQK